MLEIDISGYRMLRLEHLVLDYNGTLACDGGLLDGVKDRLKALTDVLSPDILIALDLLLHPLRLVATLRS